MPDNWPRRLSSIKQMIALEPDLPGVYSKPGARFRRSWQIERSRARLAHGDFIEARLCGSVFQPGKHPQGPWQAGGSPIGASSGHPPQPRSVESALQSWVSCSRGLAGWKKRNRPIAERSSSSPARASAHGNLGLLLGELGRIDEARQAAQEAVRLAPDDPHHWRNLGWLKKFEDRRP